RGRARPPLLRWSPGYRSSRNCSTLFRLATATGDSLSTTIPSVAGVPQEGTSFGCPWTETRQIRQLATLVSLGYQQRAGISTPAARAALRIVAPGSKGIVLPFRVKLGIASSLRPSNGPAQAQAVEACTVALGRGRESRIPGAAARRVPRRDDSIRTGSRSQSG